MPEPETGRQPTKPEFDAAIGEVLSGIVARMDADDAAMLQGLEASPLIAAARKAAEAGDAQAFRFALPYRLDRLVDAVLKQAFPKSPDLRFLFGHDDMVRLHFRNLFQKYEGSACCADKAGTMTYALIAHFRAGKPIAFDPDARNSYAHPSRIFTTQDQILAFFRALQRLRYGHPEEYVAILNKLEAEFGPDAGAAS